jgi:hypothetical protein
VNIYPAGHHHCSSVGDISALGDPSITDLRLQHKEEKGNNDVIAKIASRPLKRDNSMTRRHYRRSHRALNVPVRTMIRQASSSHLRRCTQSEIVRVRSAVQDPVTETNRVYNVTRILKQCPPRILRLWPTGGAPVSDVAPVMGAFFFEAHSAHTGAPSTRSLA